jgi:drug/metabolite transporter (DMT)-like permease
MTKRTVWIAFSVLCLVSGTYWALPSDGTLPVLERQALIFGCTGLLALCFVRHSTTFNKALRLSLAGVGFFGVPIAVVEIVRGSVGGTTRSASFALVPVVVVLVLATGDTVSGVRRLLPPALVGLGGLLLLLPLEFSTSIRGQLMLGLLGAAVILAGVCSVWLYRALQDTGLATAIAILGVANAVFLMLTGFLWGEMVWGWSELASAVSLASLVDGVEIAAIVWLLREIPPARLAARYLLIPLVTILESYILMRPQMTARMVFGTMLLAAGAGMLLFLKDVDQDSPLSLR